MKSGNINFVARCIGACAALAAALVVFTTLIPVRSVAAHANPDPRSELLVTSDWLSQHINDPNLVLLHVGDRSEYDAGHLPGARYVSLSDVSTAHEDGSGLMLQMPPLETLRQNLAALGISDDSRIIVYYGNDWVTPATRVVFTLDYAGLGANTSLLDGGMKAWRRGRALTKDLPAKRTGSLAALKTKSIIVDAEFVKANIGKAGVSVVDGRAAAFYDGVEIGRGMHGPHKKGHIAGARSIPFTEITNANLELKSPAELAALFSKAGVKPGDTIIGYCHIGQQATGMLFAARTLGYRVALYDGSFEDWSTKTGYPVLAGKSAK
ncbi:MAG TPA: rhodanese-like domain-containing protein [Gemmatimonadaceae bacterium]|nr:rhodanese-like domain-containing protein [Gemmatimonadaceae bacterium]